MNRANAWSGRIATGCAVAGLIAFAILVLMVLR